jgi:hypothetical protein
MRHAIFESLISPAKAGVQMSGNFLMKLDPGLRRDDDEVVARTLAWRCAIRARSAQMDHWSMRTFVETRFLLGSHLTLIAIAGNPPPASLRLASARSVAVP